METKPKTNADRIREMSDEELAVIMENYICDMAQDAGMCGSYDGREQCRDCCLAWLRAPVEESGT